jgi:hypothetical protein
MSSKKRRISMKACLALFFYLIIPLCSLLLILQLYPELPKDRFYMRIYWVVPTALVIILIAQLSAFYQKGDMRRFLLNIGFTIGTILWMFGLLGGGVVITTQWNGYDFSLHMDKYVVLIVCVAVINVVYYALEWRVYRNDIIPDPSHEKNKSGTIVE